MSETKREAILTVVIGMMGVGKSHLTKIIMKAYAKTHGNRKQVVFDPNNEETYHEFASLYYDIREVQQRQARIAQVNKERDKKNLPRITLPLTKSEMSIANFKASSTVKTNIRRIIPLVPTGNPNNPAIPMSPDEMQFTMINILNNFKNGHVLIDDINKHTNNFEKGAIKAMFKAIRHSDQDITIHMQSANPIPPVLWEAVSVVRFHKCNVSIDKVKDKTPTNYEILKLAEYIVNEQYDKHKQFPARSPKWFAFRSFCLFVHTADQKIKGCTADQFRRACENFMTMNPKATYHEYAMQIALANNRMKPNISDVKAARQKWINVKMSYIV